MPFVPDSFTPKAWHNFPSTTTPLTAEALIDLEDRLAAYTAAEAKRADEAAEADSDAIGTAAADVAVETARAVAAEGLLAPLASPALTGNPTAPTQGPGSNSTRLATTAFVKTAREEIEAACDKLGEAAAEKARAIAAEALLAPLASPVLTGTPTAPTAAEDDNSTKLSTTAYADRAADEARADAEALAVPLTQKGAANGVGTLDGTGHQPLSESPLSVANGSMVGAGQNGVLWNLVLKVWQGANISTVGEDGCINALKYLDIPSGTIDFVALCKAMEEQFKAAYFSTNFTMKAQVLLNMAAVPGELKEFFKYRFVSRNGVVGTLPKMANGQFAMRANQNAEGVKEGSSLYPHQDVIFENISWRGSGENDGGSVFSGYNRTVKVVNSQLSNLNNGYVEEGFSDGSHIDTLTTYGKNVTGWCYKTGEGDGKTIKYVEAYACKGVFVTRGTGTATGLVSGIHQFVVAGFTFSEPHLEGDGPNEASGKPSEALIILNGGDYVFQHSRFFTLTNPARPCIEITDVGAAERATIVVFEHVRFMQRLDDPANPTGKVQPVGNLQGVALKFVGLSPKSIVKFVDTYGEVFQQTSENSQFDTRARIGLKFTAPEQEGLLSQLTARRVMLSSTDSQLRYNSGVESWEIRPVGSNMDSVTTRRFGQPLLTLTKFAAASEQAKAAPTTRGTGTHYYVVWAIDDRGRRTSLSAEKSVTLAAGEVPNIAISTGYPSRVILEHGTSAGVFTDWVEIILPIGQAVLADMGSAIGGQAWSSEAVPARPGTGTAENNTAGGRVLLDSGGIAESYGSTIFTTGEWQKAGDLFTVPSGRIYVCTVSAAANNGGTWTALPFGQPGLATGESTVARRAATTGGLTMTSQLLRLGFFTAEKSETITKLRVGVGTTVAGSTPTLIRLGVYSINPATKVLTLIRSTVNDTTLLAAQATYEKALSESWAKVAGERYAIGLLVVTAAAAPTIAGISIGLPATELGVSPRESATLAAQANLPETINDDGATAPFCANSTGIPYFAMVP